ncbi:MAG: EexN family lipoprotein [Woeseiaceae bacterium]|nr:EexN family lipoprotein [Woeseiaceae bacterium]
MGPIATLSRLRFALLLCGAALVGACAEEPKPRSVPELLENPIVLEAVMVRCNANRTQTRYDAECVNARQAVSMLEAREDRERAKAFEAQSQRKREALRRTQTAAAEARRRAQEAERLREETAYLAQFGELPPSPEDDEAMAETESNVPGAVLPDPEEADESPATGGEATLPASDGGNAPTMSREESADLGAIREELQRRNDGSED